MNIRKFVVRAVLVVIGLPVVSVLIAVVFFYASFYPSTRANGTIVSSGQKREYLLHIPPNYDPPGRHLLSSACMLRRCGRALKWT